MEQKRLLELLSYAQVCFDKCTNPFSLRHLQKKDVNANECRDLSVQLSSIIEEWINEICNPTEQKEALEKAKREFAETQGDA